MGSGDILLGNGSLPRFKKKMEKGLELYNALYYPLQFGPSYSTRTPTYAARTCMLLFFMSYVAMELYILPINHSNQQSLYTIIYP